VVPPNMKRRSQPRSAVVCLYLYPVNSHPFIIPQYKEINDFLQSFSSGYQTGDPNLYCLRLKENMPAMEQYKPPFKKDFYFIALVNNAGDTKITYDNTSVTELNSFLVFQAPGLLYSFSATIRPPAICSILKKNASLFSSRILKKSFRF
jgi:AraC family transcriptional regulator, transcriptional activator of pobA